GRVTPAHVRAFLPLLGIVGIAILVWRTDIDAVRTAVLQVGWGIGLVVSQEIVAHLLNTLGWRLAFAREQVATLPLGHLLRLRLAGDAINYLTPSASLAGEYARAAMLTDRIGSAARADSVVIAKSAQAIAQMTFVAAGLTVLRARVAIPEAGPSPAVWALAFGLPLAPPVVGALPPSLRPAPAALRSAARP